MVRPESSIRPTGEVPSGQAPERPVASPSTSGRPRRAERGVEILFGGSKHAGHSITGDAHRLAGAPDWTPTGSPKNSALDAHRLAGAPD